MVLLFLWEPYLKSWFSDFRERWLKKFYNISNNPLMDVKFCRILPEALKIHNVTMLNVFIIIHLIFATFPKSSIRKKVSSHPEVVKITTFLLSLFSGFSQLSFFKAHSGMSIKCVASSNCAWHILLYLENESKSVVKKLMKK